jgi:hypothetical protein
VIPDQGRQMKNTRSGMNNGTAGEKQRGGKNFPDHKILLKIKIFRNCSAGGQTHFQH